MRKKYILFFICSFLMFFDIFSSNLFDNERLVYDIRYGIVTAGEASLNIHKYNYREQPVWKIFSTAETNSFFDKIFKVRDYIESIATSDSLYSLRFTKRMQEGKYRQHRIHENYLEQNLSVYSSFSYSKGLFNDRTLKIPKDTYDILSSFYKVRTMDLVPGQTVELSVTADGKNFIALIHVLRKETISTFLGPKSCLVIEPALEGDALFKQTGEIHIWLTDDERKLPVLLQSKVIFGNFRATLKSIEKVKL